MKIEYIKMKITRLTHEGLEFVSVENTKHYIDFNTCHNNLKKKLHLQDNQSRKYVGFRNYSAEPPYIELCTKSLTVFKFPCPQKKEVTASGRFYRVDPQDYIEYIDFQNQLEEVGWATYRSWLSHCINRKDHT